MMGITNSFLFGRKFQLVPLDLDDDGLKEEALDGLVGDCVVDPSSADVVLLTEREFTDWVESAYQSMEMDGEGDDFLKTMEGIWKECSHDGMVLIVRMESKYGAFEPTEGV